MKSQIYTRILGLFAVLAIFSLFSVSAYSYDWNYGPAYDSYNGYGNSYGNSNDYYKETTTVNSRNTDYFRDDNGRGKQTVTVKATTTVQKDYSNNNYNNRNNYGSSCSYYGSCSSSQGYGYKQPYNYRNYGDDNYGNSYYYQPRYDWHSQYYNWRY